MPVCRLPFVPAARIMGVALGISLLGAALAGSDANELKPLKADDAASPTLSVKQLGSTDRAIDWITATAFSPDGRSLFVGSKQSLKRFSTSPLKYESQVAVPAGFVRAIAFSPDGAVMAAAGYGWLQLWDREFKMVTSFRGHRANVTGVAWSPAGDRLVTTCEDEKLRLWSIDRPEPLWEVAAVDGPQQHVAWSPNGKLLATAEGDPTRPTRPGVVTLRNAQTGEPLHKFEKMHLKAATSVAFSNDGSLLASTSLDEKVNLYDVEKRLPIGFFGGHARPTSRVLFHPSGRALISATGGGFAGPAEIKVWSPDGDELASLEGHEARITSLAISPDGKMLASAGYDQVAMLWNLSALVDEPAAKPASPELIRVGIIGLDTSHAPAFAKVLNDVKAADDVAGVRIVAAYPKGSEDIESSTKRVPEYIEQMKALDVAIVDSIPELVSRVDAVLLEANDGRPHWKQAVPVVKARKPLFIDKPLAGSLAECVALFELAKRLDVPIFTSSSLRYGPGAQELRAGKHGAVFGCDAYSPCSLEPTHPDLFWYGIHGVETLFTVMGPGCESVARVSTPNFELATGCWNDGRIGTFRGIRKGAGGYGGTAFTEKSVVPIGNFAGYRPLVVEIVKFLKTKQPPVSAEESLQIYAFMEAADESKRHGGAPVKLDDVMKAAREQAAKLVEAALAE